ncbi:MAG: aminotransferase class V-fold PLP-dependent enzyme [Candidatus Methanomethylicia archaeon]|nr:aminotransferase class V-fold PLP-dependent enzyme [Candidatus Methanomethylicia archaeon]
MKKNFKQDFPALGKYKSYLNTAAEGLTPRKVLESLKTFIDKTGRNEWNEPIEEIEKPAKREISKLIGCSIDEISFSIQTTDGFRRILLSIKPKAKGNIVGVDLEFPSISLAIRSLSEKIGNEVRIVKHKNGKYDVSDFEKVIDDDTYAVVFSSVIWVNGFMMPIKEISEIAHEKGALVIVDGVQHVGAISMDVKKLGIDAMAVGGEKWLLNNIIGSGFIYVSNEIIENLEPLAQTLLNYQEPEVGWSTWWTLVDKDPWKPLKNLKTASKLDWGGGKPYILIEALRSSVEYINNIEINCIEKYNKMLKEKVIEETLNMGFEVISYTEDKNQWSSITTISTGKGYEYEVKIVKELRNEGIQVSYRGSTGIGGIRISPHLYNDYKDIEILFSKLKCKEKI